MHLCGRIGQTLSSGQRLLEAERLRGSSTTAQIRAGRKLGQADPSPQPHASVILLLVSSCWLVASVQMFTSTALNGVVRIGLIGTARCAGFGRASSPKPRMLGRDSLTRGQISSRRGGEGEWLPPPGRSSCWPLADLLRGAPPPLSASPLSRILSPGRFPSPLRYNFRSGLRVLGGRGTRLAMSTAAQPNALRRCSATNPADGGRSQDRPSIA